MHLAGLSYGHSLAYPHFTRPARTPSYDQEALKVVLELVHPGQFHALPPSPAAIAGKGQLMGLGDFKTFFH